MRRLAPMLVALLACAGLPASAHAHALLGLDSGVLSISSPDSVSVDQIAISSDGANVKVRNPTVAGGMDPGPCTPVTEYEVDCPAGQVSSVTADMGPHNDRWTTEAALPSTVYGGPGQDAITGGPVADILDGGDGFDRLFGGEGDDALSGRAGEDSLDGGPGNDILVGGEELDTFQGGPGDDDIRSRDGVPESVSCGDGDDRVTADPTDVVGVDCETVDRGFPGADPPPEETRPAVSVWGRRVQRPLRAGSLVVAASSSKAGKLTAYGEVTVFNVTYRLTAVTLDVAAGQKVTFRARIGRGVQRQMRSAFKRRSRMSAMVRLRAIDSLGNRSDFRRFRVRVAR